jgi:putative transcriptional regulator
MTYKIKLKEVRQKKGLTQQELAKKFDIKQTNISEYESGKQKPSLDTFIEMAKILDLSLDELIEYIDVHEAYSNDIKKLGMK